MEPLRERVADAIRDIIDDRGGRDQKVKHHTAVILQAVEEDRAKLKEWHEEIAQSQQRWRARAEKAEAREAAMREAIEWALGERDDFPHRQPGEGSYWWRKELRRRAALALPADSLAQEVVKYMRHLATCDKASNLSPYTPCTCGLDALLAKLGGPK